MRLLAVEARQRRRGGFSHHPSNDPIGRIPVVPLRLFLPNPKRRKCHPSRGKSPPLSTHEYKRKTGHPERSAQPMDRPGLLPRSMVTILPLPSARLAEKIPGLPTKRCSYPSHCRGWCGAQQSGKRKTRANLRNSLR